MNSDLIDRFEAGGQALGDSIADLTPTERNAFPVPGSWSIQQIVLHLLDSDLILCERMKRVVAEDEPTLSAFSETAFANNLFYDQMDATLACTLFHNNRTLTAMLLRCLPDDAFSRAGLHTERGRLTVQQLLETTVNHLEHHMKFLLEKRGILGKPTPVAR